MVEYITCNIIYIKVMLILIVNMSYFWYDRLAIFSIPSRKFQLHLMEAFSYKICKFHFLQSYTAITRY